MVADQEQEAISLLVQHHNDSKPENDIRYTFQRFMEAADVAAASDMSI